MDTYELRRRALRALQLFIVLRCSEALFATIAGALTAFAVYALKDPGSYPALSWGDFRASWMISQTYYLSFGYLYVSALIFLLSALVFDLNSRRKLIVTNVGAFVLHSVTWIVLFSGITVALWIQWIEIALFNWVMSSWVWGWRLIGAPRA